MITCRLVNGVDLKHSLDILIAALEADSRLASSLLPAEYILCTRSSFWILSMICKSSLGFFDLLPIRFNSHFA